MTLPIRIRYRLHATRQRQTPTYLVARTVSDAPNEFRAFVAALDASPLAFVPATLSPSADGPTVELPGRRQAYFVELSENDDGFVDAIDPGPNFPSPPSLRDVAWLAAPALAAAFPDGRARSPSIDWSRDDDGQTRLALIVQLDPFARRGRARPGAAGRWL